MKFSIVILLIFISITTSFASLTQESSNSDGLRKVDHHKVKTTQAHDGNSLEIESFEILKPANAKEHKSTESYTTRSDSTLKPLGGKCYYYSNDKRDFNGAFNYCLYNNMRLVSLPTEADNAFLSSYLRNAGFDLTGDSKIWSSGQKQTCNGSWVWSGLNQPTTYANWNNGEPNNLGGNENCIELFQSNRKTDLIWNDVNCRKSQRFICESSCSRN